eukprot:TRINITY_DN1794_c0_g1_i2.p1 TRINITY_DN1794_c0_g1~~TRINITY_DN1794_c0_g1_i2.p1  ORF type:complete len:455 (-),score=110.45 TRINITY_DN1794_c0_g1_i2:373-1737(-)
MAAAPTAPLLPISEISTYNSRWTIRARVTNKAPLRSFSKNGGSSGKVFSCDLLDKEGGEIRASFFNDAADKYFDIMNPGKCFELSRGNVKVANRQYSNLNHRYELNFDRDAQVTEVPEDNTIESFKFHFTDLREVQAKAVPHRFDLCGVVVSYKPTLAFTSKEGKELVKCEITLADDTAMTMDVAVWGDRAKDDSKFAGQPIIALKGVLVKEWNGGRAGSLLQDGGISFAPEGPEAARVKKWWSQGGSSQSLTALSAQAGAGAGGQSKNAKQLSLAELRQVAEKVGDKPEYYAVYARLALVQTRKQGEPQPLTYLACTEPREGTNGLLCQRRVDESGFCAACNKATKPAARMNTRCRFSDSGDSAWLTTFHDGAEVALHMTAEEARKREAEGADMEAQLRASYFAEPLRLTVRAKLDHYQGEARPNISCIDAKPVDRRQHGRQLLAELREMLSA